MRRSNEQRRESQLPILSVGMHHISIGYHYCIDGMVGSMSTQREPCFFCGEQTIVSATSDAMVDAKFIGDKVVCSECQEQIANMLKDGNL